MKSIKKLIRYFSKKKVINHISWYEAKPSTFNKKSGHEDFRKGNYRAAFKKYAKKDDIKLKDTFDKGVIQSICISLYGGLGDNLQFLRFVKVIKERYGSYICIVVSKKYLPLCEVLERLQYVDKVCCEEECCSGDIGLSIKSLPYLLDIGLHDLPAESYLNIDTYPSSLLRFNNELANNDFKVGIHWSTGKNSGDSGENNRNINLDYFKKINNRNIKLYSLEKNNIDLCGDLLITQLGESRSLLMTELIIKKMNLVITTDTAIAHLSGAVGVETWILLPHPCPSWRYYINEHSTPWYPKARLIRQTSEKNWSTVFENINELIDEKVSKYS